MKSTLFFIFFLLLANSADSQIQEISFNHLTVENGLSHNGINTIYQDEQGYLWIGTRNGINRYNGKDVKIYRHDRYRPNTPPHNYINYITGDGNGHIFFQTGVGVFQFDIATEQFTTLIQNNTGSMYYADGLYISIQNAIYRYNGTKFLLHCQLPDKQIQISRIHIGSDSILIGTKQNGVYIANQQQKLTHPIMQGDISDIQKDSRGRYWIADRKSGLYKLEGQQVSYYTYKESDPASIGSYYVHKCCEDQEGNIWIGTFNGLNRYNETTDNFIRYPQCNNEKGLSHPSIWSLFCDRQGTIWAGTYFGGVNYFNLKHQIFQEYYTGKEDTSLSSSIVGCFTEDDRHNLWIGTEGGGLNKLNPNTRTFTRYKANGKPGSLTHNNIKALYYDRELNVLWIGTHLGGLNRMDLSTGRFTCYLPRKNDPESLPSDIVSYIIPYQDKLLLATHGGVCLFDKHSGKCQTLFQEAGTPYFIQMALKLLIDHQGKLWIIGHGRGVCTYRFDTGEMKQYLYSPAMESGLSSNIYNNLYEDSNHRIWFCTSDNGVDLYHPETDSFENFGKYKNELADNTVYAICELTEERMLLTTEDGFSILDLPTKNFTNYNQANGFPRLSVNAGALYRTSQGEIFIGGINGMVAFYPEKLDTPLAHNNYRIYPYQLTVNGKEIEMGEEDGMLTRNLSNTRQIILKDHQNHFSIDYAVTNYLPCHTDELVYQLKGFSNAWNPLPEEKKITYTNLEAGKYILTVKAKNNPDIPESKLEIRILPPFYQTVWAYLFYAACLFGFIWAAIRSYQRHIKLKEKLKYEQKRVEDIEALNQSKLRFFTNISHEFRTPLTLIIGQMELLLQLRFLAPVAYNKILGVYKNCLQLRELINELLDFRKQEQGYMTIKVNEHNIVSFVYELYLSFQEYAQQRNITFTFQKSHDDLPVWYDAKQLQKVVVNLLSNAFKYTPEGGKINVGVRKGNQEVIIDVTDTGKGIAPQDIEKIFHRFYQTDETEPQVNPGTGIGLALAKGIVELHHGTIEVYSELTEGSTFSVHLKTGNAHFTKEQIREEKDSHEVQKNEFVLPDAVQETILEAEVMPQPAATGQTIMRKMVVAEDNDALRDMLAKLFAPFYTVTVTANGREAWEKIQEEQPDIVVSDVLMPEMSGTELCKLLKNNLETCHIPIVLLTARTAPEHNMEGLRLGADDYITKPFNLNILISRCNNLVNNRMMLQEKFSKQPQAVPQILATNSLDKALLEQVTAIIEQNLSESEFNVDVLARETHMARTKLFTKLKAITGQTPYEFITTIRVKKAALLLKEHPEMSIAEISDALGFSSPRQFSKNFKDKYQVSPLIYRKGEKVEED